MTQGPKQTWDIPSVGTRITYMPKALTQFSTVVFHKYLWTICVWARNSATRERQMMACHGTD
jgi:hypothetical protein